jgi:predicted Abi (CAAX) family protease
MVQLSGSGTATLFVQYHSTNPTMSNNHGFESFFNPSFLQPRYFFGLSE